MEELMMKLEKISKLKETIMGWAEAEAAKGVQCIDAEEFGACIDMIKDLAKAEKDCAEAAYYCEVIKAMKEYGEEEEYDERRGYNSHRSARTGRYTSGRGMRGYTPVHEMMHEWEQHPDRMMKNMRLGYDHDVRMNRTPYDQYRDARRHYTETRSPEAKDEMSKHAQRHANEAIESMRDIWKDADPELKMRLRTDFQGLLSEMTV